MGDKILIKPWIKACWRGEIRKIIRAKRVNNKIVNK